MSLYIWLLLFAVTGLKAHAQYQVWRHFDVGGMSNTNIVCVTEDRDGLLYLGTHGGLNIFDGRRFHAVDVPKAVEKGINPFVNQMRWGKNGLLWVCTRTHIYTYDPAERKTVVLYGNESIPSVGSIEVDTVGGMLYFAHYDTLLIAPLCDTAVRVKQRIPAGKILESRLTPNGKLFLFLDNRRIVRLDAGRLVTVFENARVIDMDYDEATRQIVVLCAQRLVAIDCETGKIRNLPQRCTWPYELAKTRLTTTRSGRMLVQHGYGMDVYSNIYDTVRVRMRADPANPAGLKSDFVLYAYEDKRDNLWVCEDGINLSVLPANSRGLSYVSEKMTGATRLWASFHDASGKEVFTGSEFGVCRLRYTGDTPQFVKGIKPAGMRFFEPLGMVRWTANELLLLTNGQGNWLLNTHTLALRMFDTIAKRSGTTSHYSALPLSASRYVFYGRAGLYILDRARGQFIELPVDSSEAKLVKHMGVLAVMIDNRKRIWVADGHSLHILDSSLHILKTYEAKSDKNPSGLGNTVIMDIKQARNGDIYIATMGGGLMKLTSGDTFRKVPLVNDIISVFCIAELNKEYLLITSGNGLVRYNQLTGSSSVLSESYGLPVSDFNQLALTWDDSLFAAAGTKGYVVAGKSAIQQLFTDTVHVVLMQGASALRSITLPKGVENAEVSIAIPGYLAAADWRIRYRLEGVDADWRQLGKGEWEIRYNSIKPGEYKLQVEAIDNSNVVFAYPASISVTALPFFWQTKLFRVLMLLVGLTLLVVIVRFFSQLQLKWRLKKLEDEQKVARERIRISRELHDNVGSQLTYLISGLESSNLLLRKHDTERLEQKLGKMQASARESMQQLRDSIWALNNESVLVSVLFSRFRQWMEHIMDAAPDMHYSISGNVVEDVSLDPIRSLNLFRIMQEAVHNVLKHSKAHNLRVSYQCEGGSLSVIIEDDGVGFEQKATGGNGQKTMVARAEEAGGKASVKSVKGKGTVVSIEITTAGF